MADTGTDKSGEATQSYAALGVGFVCILVGLPLWWKTTEVYRVQLPYGDIADLQADKVFYRVPFSVIVFETRWAEEKLSNLAVTMKKSFESLESGRNGSVTVHYKGNIRKGLNEEKEHLALVKNIEEFDERLSRMEGWQEPGRYFLIVLPWDTTLLGLQGAGVIGRHRAVYVKASEEGPAPLVDLTNHIIREMLVEETAVERVIAGATGARHMEADKESMRSVHYQPGYDVTFTLFNPQPAVSNVHWDIRTGIKKYLQSFLKSFEGLAEIAVKSQCLHYGSMPLRPQRDNSGNFSVLRQDNLPHIINPIEAYLGSHVSVNPHLNFILYTPSQDHTPLYIVDHQGQAVTNNAFLSPRWGGMMVYNMEPVQDDEVLPARREVDMKVIMETFLSQLRLLLGINTQVSSHGLVTLQPGNKGLNTWELDGWMRSRTLENVATATATLQSLIQLLSEVGNIVINDDIGNEVSRAVASISQTHRYLKAGRLKDGFLASRQAIISSEKAFFDPSLLELLYFPEDQKFAIYIPLFLPISIPILLSLIRAVKWLRTTRKGEKTD